ncbi:kinase-like domain-containing protein [Podospora australis]|uniref:Kinase-like domain-containing protein n=1 Tax=Podospora australis TaxID=1536484 RepID=A0AAN7ADG6_9PEZI|nr:kinase-like domain-containing protein [Podospora australis]
MNDAALTTGSNEDRHGATSSDDGVRSCGILQDATFSSVPQTFAAAFADISMASPDTGIEISFLGGQFTDFSVSDTIDENADTLVLNSEPPQQTSPLGQVAKADLLSVAIRDLDSTTHQRAIPVHSVITDLGDALRHRRHKQCSKFDISSGKLNNKLSAAFRKVQNHDGPPSNFLPYPDILRLINPESVFEELKRSRRPRIRRSNTTLSIPSKKSPGGEPMKINLKGKGSAIKDLLVNTPIRSKIVRIICGIHDPKGTGEPQPTFQGIFAVLVLLDKSLAIRRFIKHRVCDDDLPLRFCGGKFYRRKDHELRHPLSCFRGWKDTFKRGFEKLHWQVKAPYFGRRENDSKPLHFSLDPEVVLPFTSLKQIGEGSHGRVFKVGIHKGHHDFHHARGRGQPSQDHSDSFALKELHMGGGEMAFHMETMVPKLLTDEKTEHLIPLRMTYQQHGKYYLLFDLAKSDLSEFWHRVNPNCSAGRKAALWLARECANLAHGLAQIHALAVASLSTTPTTLRTPRHGDVKAENVLAVYIPASSHGNPDHDNDEAVELFNYTLKISDFSLATAEPIKKPGNLSGQCTSPPEFATKREVLGNSCDIWALGCLFLMFIAWYFGGAELLNKLSLARNGGPRSGFHGDDRFFQIKKDVSNTRQAVAEVKPEIIEFVKQLRKHERCSPYFHDFLDLIQNGMLVVEEEEVGDVNEPSTRRREKCDVIYKRLSNMYEHCKKDKAYAFGVSV